MEMLKRLDPLFLFLLIVGALNWGILGVTGGETNVVSEIFGTGNLHRRRLCSDRRRRVGLHTEAARGAPHRRRPAPARRRAQRLT